MKTITYNKYGGPDVLEITETDKPELPDNKLLVKVKASSINPVDYKVRRGDMKILSGKKFPKSSGSDFAGVVEEAGSIVEGYQKGDNVYGFINPMKGGAYSEYIIADPKNVSHLPDALSFEEAASMPVAALTALQSLCYLSDVKEGSSVLINGATGGVGSFAVQIAKGLGAEVTGICSGKNMELCKKLGAGRVYDYSKEYPGGSDEKFDVFFDAAAKSTFSKSKRFLKEKGVFITTVPGLNVIVNRLFNFIPFRKKSKFIMVKSSGVDLAILKGFTVTKDLKPVVEKIFPIGEIVDAFELAESGNVRGKIVVKI